jgi:uncharacterized lipoprotein YddW (UPF0748 family)
MSGSRAKLRIALGKQQQSGRFRTGILLGLILALVLGMAAPLLAQEPPSNSLGASEKSLSQSQPSQSQPPPEFHWAQDCITGLAARDIVSVDDQGYFYPDRQATWADLTTFLNRSFPATEPAPSWASAVEQALVLPSPVHPLYSYPPQYYLPGRVITRTEAMIALAAKRSLPYVARPHDLLNASLIDGAQVPSYGREGVAMALDSQLVVNYPEAQRLNPNQPMQRGELAALICRASDDTELRQTIDPSWVAQPQALLPQVSPNPELRGVWLTNIDSEVLFSQANLAAGVERLKALNFNTLYPVVWNGGYTLYPSAIAERILGRKQRLFPGENPAFEAIQNGRDMLQEAIALGHEAGMAVIPWFEFGFMAPADYEVRRQHPDWFTQRQDGSGDIQQGAETFSWMNPFHPRVQQMLLLLLDEVLQNYDVEGIQFDDHLGMPVDMGYDPYTVALYRQEHNGAAPPEDENEPEWQRWRADKITAFVGQVHQLVKSRRPDGIVSISPNPYPFSYARYLQDWPEWEKQGYVDELIVQVYRDNLDRFAWELNKPATVRARYSTPTAIGLLSGLRGRPTDIGLLETQLAAVRDRDYAGVAYFFYETLWVPGNETAAERQSSLATSFARTARRPSP